MRLPFGSTETPSSKPNPPNTRPAPPRYTPPTLVGLKGGLEPAQLPPPSGLPPGPSGPPPVWFVVAVFQSAAVTLQGTASSKSLPLVSTFTRLGVDLPSVIQ